MARAIDGNELYRIEKLLDTDIVRQDKVALNLLEQVLYDIQHVPTLTPQNEWVSVEERLPENDAPVGRKQITVLVCSKAKKVSVASRIYEPEREYRGKVYPARWRWSKLMNKYVTHWMPLPAPPDSCQPEGEEDT